MAQPGWTVHVASGTYNEDVTFSASGTATSRIRFISDTRWGAKVVGVSSNIVLRVNGNYVDVMGFEVVGALSSQIGVATYAHDAQIVGNKVHDTPAAGSTLGCFAGAGIFIGTGSLAATTNVGSNLVDSNYVYNVGLFPLVCNQAHGIYVGTPKNTVTNNIVFRCQAYGIHIYGHTTNETVVNNTAFNNGKSGIIISSDGTIVDDNTTVNNNIAVNNGVTLAASGIQEESYPSGYIGTHNVYSNNLTFGSSAGGYSLAISTPIAPLTSGTNSSVFVNYTGDQTGDYHLQSGSPAMGAGTSSAAPLTDFDGRPRSAGWDIGAYEWSSAPAVWPWQ